MICPKCDAEYDRKPKKCSCGYRFADSIGPDKPPEVRKCATCGITQEQYSRKLNAQLDKDFPKVVENKGQHTYPHEFDGLGRNWYCREHSPQMAYSMKQMNKLLREKGLH